MRKLYLRQCDICKNGMSLGYIWDDSYYMCGEYCYQVALIDNALWFADNEHLKMLKTDLSGYKKSTTNYMWVGNHKIIGIGYTQKRAWL